MQQLYSQLTGPVIEFNDKGEQISRPPTSVMLRAARTIKTLLDTNNTNMGVINQQGKEIESLINQLKVANESLHKIERETSDVGSGSAIPDGSNTISEAGTEATKAADPDPN